MDTLTTEYQSALAEWEQAWRNFDNAELEFVDVAAHNLLAAERKLGSIIKEMKKEASACLDV